MLLQDSLNADKSGDERVLFKNRQSTMLSRGKGGGGSNEQQQQVIKLIKRYALVDTGLSGQGCEVQICRGDLTKVGTEALVTSASPDLSAGGMGINSRVHSAAGSVLSRLVARVAEVAPGLRCDTGDAVATDAGDLPVIKVIHAVGPVHPKAPLWHELVYAGKHARHQDRPLGVPRKHRNYEAQEVPHLLEKAYGAAMSLINKHKLRTFSTPALSCDVGGYPPAEAAEIAFKAVLKRANIGGSECSCVSMLDIVTFGLLSVCQSADSDCVCSSSYCDGASACAVELIQFVLPDPPNELLEKAFVTEAARQLRLGRLQSQSSHARDPRTGEELDTSKSSKEGDADESSDGDGLVDEQTELLRIFQQFDRDGDGTVTPAEFRQGLNRCDIEVPKAHLMTMVERLSNQKVDAVWDTVDRDGSGDIDANELSTVVKTMGKNLSEDDVARLARKLDRDHDGTISKTEFQKWWAKQPASAKEKLVGIDYHEFVTAYDPLKYKLRRLFNDIDESKDGTLDAQEIWRLCRDMGAELEPRELREAMRDMDADGSGEIDFDEFYAWMNKPRKHNAKLARAMSEFRAKRTAGATRQERPFGKPTGGSAGDQTFERAKGAYLSHKLKRKPQPSSLVITQLDKEQYEQQQHAGVLYGEPPVSVKPGQQAGSGTRESHYEGPRGAAVGKLDPNGYVPYKPHEEVIAASLEKLMDSLPLADQSLAPVWKEIDNILITNGEIAARLRPVLSNTVAQSLPDSEMVAIERKLPRRTAKVASLRKELEGLSSEALKKRAHDVGVDKELVAKWWSGPQGAGMQTSATVPKNANEDNHYTLVPPWNDDDEGYGDTKPTGTKKRGHLTRVANTRVGRYVGLLAADEEVKASDDLDNIQDINRELHTWIDPRSCWVGGIPRKHASESAMRQIFEDHGVPAVSITVRVKTRLKTVHGKAATANRSWALVEFVDKDVANRARKMKVMVDDGNGQLVALKVREAQVEQRIARANAEAEAERSSQLLSSLSLQDRAKEGEIKRVTVEYPLNEGGWGAGSRWPDGSRDEEGDPQGRMSYPLKNGTDGPLTKGRWVGGSADSRNGYKATVERREQTGNTAPVSGVSKDTDRWGLAQYAPPERPKAKSSVHQEVINAIVSKVEPSRAFDKRDQLHSMKVRQLKEEAEAAGVDRAVIENWWSVVGEKMTSQEVSKARHLQVHWNKRYIGRNPDQPFAGWGERPGHRETLRYS